MVGNRICIWSSLIDNTKEFEVVLPTCALLLAHEHSSCSVLTNLDSDSFFKKNLKCVVVFRYGILFCIFLKNDVEYLFICFLEYLIFVSVYSIKSLPTFYCLVFFFLVCRSSLYILDIYLFVGNM